MTASALGACALAACSLLVDSSDLAGVDSHPADGGTRADGGVVESDSAGIKAAGDGAPAENFCAGQTEPFCEDFDAPGFPARWNGGLTERRGGVGELAPQHFVSAPNGFTSHLPRGASGCLSANVSLLASGKTAFAGALDFYPMMGADDVSLFTVEGEAGAGACGIFVNIRNLLVEVYVGATGAPAQATAVPFAPQQWSHLTFDVDLKGSVTVSIGSASKTLNVSPCAVTFAQARFTLGMSCEDAATQDRTIHYDNVVLTPH